MPRLASARQARWQALASARQAQPLGHFAKFATRDAKGYGEDEYLAAIRQFWTEDEVDFDGKYYSYKGVATAPLPVRKPHPPIWVGGASDAALRRTVRLGDAWHPIRFQEGWFRDEGIPRLKAVAAEEERLAAAAAATAEEANAKKRGRKTSN